MPRKSFTRYACSLAGLTLCGALLLGGPQGLLAPAQAADRETDGPVCCTCVIAGLIAEFLIIQQAIQEVEDLLNNQVQDAFAALEVQLDAAQMDLEAGIDEARAEIEAEIDETRMDLQTEVRETRDTFIRFEIEGQLFDGDCVPSLWFPVANGGKLEFARDYVAFLISEAAQTGDPDVNIPVATARLVNAEDFILKGQYQRACRQLSLAVKALSP